MEKTIAKGKHKIPTAQLIRNATGKHDKATSRSPRGNQLKQDDFKILVNAGSTTVHKVFVRFGTKVGKGQHQWVTTLAMRHVKINPGHQETLPMMDDAQIPKNADSYQLLCEIDNEHGESETLMTKPTSLV